MSEAFSEILYEVDGPVATITLNRPDQLNAFTTTMQRELNQAFDLVDADDGVRALIITGAGRGFCAGADLRSGGDTFDANAQASKGRTTDADWSPDDAGGSQYPRDYGGRLALRMFGCLKPVIAAINGPAVGIGVTMTLPADIRLASERAKFGFVFAGRGIVPEAASGWFLPRIVGIDRALEWTYTARVFGPEEAQEGGLIRSIHPHDGLLPAARELADEITASAAPVSVALTRQMMWRGLGASHPMEAHIVDSRGIYSTGQSPDAMEGVLSFLEKRPPEWSMRPSTDMPEWFPWWEDPPYE